jgi:hypothetical protein
MEQDEDITPTTWNHYTELSICLDGFTIREESVIQYHNQNGLPVFAKIKEKRTKRLSPY